MDEVWLRRTMLAVRKNIFVLTSCITCIFQRFHDWEYICFAAGLPYCSRQGLASRKSACEVMDRWVR